MNGSKLAKWQSKMEIPEIIKSEQNIKNACSIGFNEGESIENFHFPFGKQQRLCERRFFSSKSWMLTKWKETKKDYSITRRSQKAKRLHDSMTDEAASIHENQQQIS